MKNTSFLLFLLISIALVACQDKDRFPPRVSLSSLNQTEFVATLESPTAADKNSIYAATLPMAWEKIKEKLPNINNIDNPTLQYLHQTKRHYQVLAPDEYEADATVEGDYITARAYFSKSLPFAPLFERHSTPILFADSQEVASFGFYDSNEAAEILFYNNDNDFAIKLLPKDTLHEIHLMMTDELDQVQSLQQAIDLLKNKTTLFENKRNKNNDWKYHFRHDDWVKIPCVSYHIEHDYPDLVGATFFNDKKDHHIVEVYQRTAFKLNEKGAEVESEAMMKVVAGEYIENKIEPKALIFNQPYLILLKRVDSPNPYFAMLVKNSELLEK